jgi:hypothetical protein
MFPYGKSFRPAPEKNEMKYYVPPLLPYSPQAAKFDLFYQAFQSASSAIDIAPLSPT